MNNYPCLGGIKDYDVFRKRFVHKDQVYVMFIINMRNSYNKHVG